MKKAVAVLILLSLALTLVSGFALAANGDSIIDILQNGGEDDGEKVLNKVDSFISFFVYKLLPLAGVLMMGISAFYLMAGAEEGKKKVASTVFGVGIVALAPTIVSWLMGMFG